MYSIDYHTFLKAKEIIDSPNGHECHADLSRLFVFQQAIVRWATGRGRAAIFADCGMGKTAMQLKWAESVILETGGTVLILSPLSVSLQTTKEGEKFGVKVHPCRKQKDVVTGAINITNYEMLHHFDPSAFSGVVIDESSILKSYSGKIRNEITSAFQTTPYRLACTASPSPNDYMELGNHSEFIGVMTRTEMLSMFFVHDGGETSQWRLKRHGVLNFWKWLASWSVMVKMPSDITRHEADDGEFVLPKLDVQYHILSHELDQDDLEVSGSQFRLVKRDAVTIGDQRKARKTSIHKRIDTMLDVIRQDADGQWIVWCDLNAESSSVYDALRKNGFDVVEVTGSQSIEEKESAMIGFANGHIQCLVSKPKIAGHGMNFQTCHNMIFFGLSHSYEAYYQAVRRCWRYGQKNDVQVHVIMTDIERPVMDNMRRKNDLAEEMATEMVRNMTDFTRADIMKTSKEISDYQEDIVITDRYRLYLGDCVEMIRKHVESDSVGFSIFSPPFSSLFTYSNSPRDMGNSKSDDEFYIHFKFLVNELYRVIIPGRIVAIHCMNIPAMKERDGYIGVKPFRNKIEELFEESGFIFHSEVVIWKDPLIEATRTKALGLMHKQLCKDSAMCRQGLPDYLVVMRKPGENPIPVEHPEGLTEYAGSNPLPKGGVLSHEIWRRYASPVWFDIRQTHTLQKEAARDTNDERHICPLQLDVIERSLTLWSNPGDMVLSPFMGIGSEVYQAVKKGRIGIGIELKPSYFNQAVKNVESATSDSSQMGLDELVDSDDMLMAWEKWQREEWERIFR